MSGNLTPPSRKRCASAGRRHRVSSAPLAALLLMCAPWMMASDTREVTARWDELPPLVERRAVDTVLTNGVYVRGRVQKVLPDALEVRVKKTSDESVIPKGVARVPRELIAVLTVKWKQGPARFLLTLVGAAWTLNPAVAPAVWPDGDRGKARFVGGMLAVTVGTGVVGYMVGAQVDKKHVRVVVAHGVISQGVVSPWGERGQDRMRIEEGTASLN